MKPKIITGGIIIGALIVLSGCGPNIGEKMVEKSIESQTGGRVDINSDKGQMNITSNEGDFSMSGEGTATLSSDFPKDIFIASDAKIIFSMANEKDKSYSAAYVTDMSVDDVYSKYKSDLEGRGWASDAKTEMSYDNSKAVTYKKGAQSVMVIVGLSQDEQWKGKTSVQVTGSEDAVSSGTSEQTQEPIDMDKEL